MIPIASEPVLTLFKFPITNTFIDTLFVDFFLLLSTLFIYKHLTLIPGTFQNIFEVITEYVYGLTETLAGENAKKIYPWVITFTLFILVSNYSGLLPGIGAIGFYTKKGFIPLLRSASTDLNVTAALALISLAATHIMSYRSLGFKEYISRFITFNNPYMLPIGLLELISEFTKIISFSFRLFGNIYAGEVLLSQLTSVFAFILPVPLMLYESFVGLVQAAVFGMLTMAFMSILITPQHEGGEA